MFDSVLRPDFSQTRFGTGAVVALATHAAVATLVLILSGQRPKAVVDPPRWPVVKIQNSVPRGGSADASHKRSLERPRVKRRDLVLPPREIVPQELPSEENRIGDPAQNIGQAVGSPDGMDGALPLDSHVPVPDLPSQRIELDESVVRLTKISGPDPEYTRQALDREVEGTMLVKCLVTAYGFVQRCRVLQSVPLMDRAVIDALEKRRYKPYVANGNPTEVDYTFKIKLRLPH